MLVFEFYHFLNRKKVGAGQAKVMVKAIEKL